MVSTDQQTLIKGRKEAVARRVTHTGICDFCNVCTKQYSVSLTQKCCNFKVAKTVKSKNVFARTEKTVTKIVIL